MGVGVQAFVLVGLDVFESVHDLAADLEIDRANAIRAVSLDCVYGLVPTDGELLLGQVP